MPSGTTSRLCAYRSPSKGVRFCIPSVWRGRRRESVSCFFRSVHKAKQQPCRSRFVFVVRQGTGARRRGGWHPHTASARCRHHPRVMEREEGCCAFFFGSVFGTNTSHQPNDFFCSCCVAGEGGGGVACTARAMPSVCVWGRWGCRFLSR